MKNQTKLPWFKRVANWCRKTGRSRTILDRTGNEPYLERFYIHPRWLTLGMFRVVIHRFWKSDDDGGLHDHPWLFWGSRILETGYWEYTPDGKFWREPGAWRWYSGWGQHRIELRKGTKEVWTLFLMGPKVREWGFIPFGTGVWVHWEEYIKSKMEKKNARKALKVSELPKSTVKALAKTKMASRHNKLNRLVSKNTKKTVKKTPVKRAAKTF